MSTNRTRQILASLVVLGVLALAAGRLLAPALEPARCDLSEQTCAALLGRTDGGDLVVVVEARPGRPAPGEQLHLLVTPAPGTEADHWTALRTAGLVVEFSMPGMDMGEHRVTLTPIESPEVAGRSALEGRITLATCPMGRSLWRASLQVGAPLDGVDLRSEVAVLDLHVGD